MIVYAVICRAVDAAVLAEFSDNIQGNAPQVTTSLMEHLRDNPEGCSEGERKTFVQKNETETDLFSNFIDSFAVAMGDTDGQNEEHFFHLYKMNGIFYCCLSDDPSLKNQNVNFAFLEHVHKEFTTSFRSSRVAKANAYAFEKQFKPTLRSAVHHYNVNQKTIGQDKRVQNLMVQVTDMKSLMGRNINVLLEREQQLNNLLTKTSSMQEDAQVFKRRSNRVARLHKRKNVFYGGIGALVAAILIYMATIGICGVGLKYCRVREANTGNNDAAEGGDP